MLASLFRRAVAGTEVHQQFPFSGKRSPTQKSHLCFFGFVSGPLDLCHGLKRQTNLPRTLSFCQIQGQTGMCLLKGWQHQMHFLGIKFEENMKVPIDSCHSLQCLPICFWMKSELFVVTCKALFGPLLILCMGRILASPQTYLWPLRTLIHSGAFVNAVLHPLTSFSGSSSETPSLGGLTWLPRPEVASPLDVPIATGACCKNTLPLNLIACLLVFLHLSLPFLLPFPLSPSSPLPSSSFECKRYKIKIPQIKKAAPDLFHLFL